MIPEAYLGILKLFLAIQIGLFKMLYQKFTTTTTIKFINIDNIDKNPTGLDFSISDRSRFFINLV